MPKKFKLDSNYDKDFTLIGIVSHLKDYRLIWAINNKLHLHLVKMEDLKILQEKKNEFGTFAMFYYNDPNTLKTYYYLSNTGEKGPLVPEHKQTNYFMLVKGNVNQAMKDEIIQSIGKIVNVLNVHSISLHTIKNIDNFLSDIELHILEIKKKEKRR